MCFQRAFYCPVCDQSVVFRRQGSTVLCVILGTVCDQCGVLQRTFYRPV